MGLDTEYFSRRMSQERDAARRATNPLARDAHLELASRYVKLMQASGDPLDRDTTMLSVVARSQASG